MKTNKKGGKADTNIYTHRYSQYYYTVLKICLSLIALQKTRVNILEYNSKTTTKRKKTYTQIKQHAIDGELALNQCVFV